MMGANLHTVVSDHALILIIIMAVLGGMILGSIITIIVEDARVNRIHRKSQIASRAAARAVGRHGPDQPEHAADDDYVGRIAG